MNIPKEVIEKAIKEGWGTPFDIPSKLLVFSTLTHEEYCGIALDPTFWQALGKALGWKKKKDFNSAHHFYDLILQEKPTHDFWQQLLK